MANVGIPRKLLGAAISEAEAAALGALSELKTVSLVETNFSAAAPDFLAVPANAVSGLVLQGLTAVSLDANAQLRLRLQRDGFLAAQPAAVTGVTIAGVAGGRAGAGTLQFTAIGTLLAWQAPGAAGFGAGVDVSLGGVFELDGGAGGGPQTLRVVVDGAAIPGGDQSDAVTVVEVDDLIPLVLLPQDEPVVLEMPVPLVVDRNTRVIFEVLGLSTGNDYSLAANCYRWVPVT